MNFSKILLEDYLETKAGRETANNLKSVPEWFQDRKKSPRFYDFIATLTHGDGYAQQAYDTIGTIGERNLVIDDATYNSFDEFENNFKLSDDYNVTLARNLQPAITLLSVLLYLKFPEFAFPILIPRHFYKIQLICKAFGISLPAMPSPTDHIGRVNYYFSLCRSFYDFRMEHGLSPSEFLVFFYGFAFRLIDEKARLLIQRNRRAFFLYTNKNDNPSRHIEDPSSETIWQGNVDMQPGDIAVMYECGAGRSCFIAVWMVLSPGFDDPFWSYSGYVFICKPVKIPEITFGELLDNAVWRESALVKAHMQHGAKTVCDTEYYAELLNMIKAKDPAFDLGTLPPPPKELALKDIVIEKEHDVETKMLEPLLEKLGYSSSDWVSQYSIRIGRENRSRPDYVIGLQAEDGIATADFVFEVKKTIPDKIQRMKDFGQACAYGRLLQATVICLVASEGVWVSLNEDNFAFSKLTYFSWDVISSTGGFIRLRNIFSTHARRERKNGTDNNPR